jgi:peroxiredoxin
MMADPDASFAKAVGLDIDATGLGLGVRSQRYAMVIQDGVVTSVFPEEDGLKILNSAAECVLDSL